MLNHQVSWLVQPFTGLTDTGQLLLTVAMLFCDMDFGPLRTGVEISVTFLKSQACLSGGKKKRLDQVTSNKFHDKDTV